MRKSATEKSPVKISNGRMASSAAAANGLLGIRAISHSWNGGSSAVVLASNPLDSRRAALAFASIASRLIKGGARIRANIEDENISAKNNPIVFPPSLATLVPLGWPAIAVISKAINSGMTTIRIALTHKVPIGATRSGREERKPELLAG